MTSLCLSPAPVIEGGGHPRHRQPTRAVYAAVLGTLNRGEYTLQHWDYNRGTIAAGGFHTWYQVTEE